jgi:hypothetical protein
MAFLNRHKRFKAVGMDIFEPYLEEARSKGVYYDLISGDVRHLPFEDRSFDAVLCLEVLEHLEKEDGERLLAELERVARKQMIISTPVGKYEQHIYDNNPHQEHKHIWSPAELRELGYKVRGHGLPRIGGEGGLASRLPKALKPLADVLYVLAGPIVYFMPQLCGEIVAKKRI